MRGRRARIKNWHRQIHLQAGPSPLYHQIPLPLLSRLPCMPFLLIIVVVPSPCDVYLCRDPSRTCRVRRIRDCRIERAAKASLFLVVTRRRKSVTNAIFLVALVVNEDRLGVLEGEYHPRPLSVARKGFSKPNPASFLELQAMEWMTDAPRKCAGWGYGCWRGRAGQVEGGQRKRDSTCCFSSCALFRACYGLPMVSDAEGTLPGVEVIRRTGCRRRQRA